MKGIIVKCMATVGLASGFTLGGGCDCYRSIVDPCYPQRYEYAARQELNGSFAPQVQNGHVLDQTVWNYQFEAGTDKLTPGGLEHLAYLARRRPCPDPMVYLQTAQDISYDPAAPSKFVEQRARLDHQRIQAVQNYLTAETASRHLTFEVVVHDPAEVDIWAARDGISIAKMYNGSQGVLPVGGAAAASGAGGGASGTGAGGASGAGR
jgi:hypothetical protein